MIAIIIYTFISLFLGKKNPLFYLILPFALQQGEAAFIDQTISIAGKNILSPYYNIFTDVLFFIVLFIAIFFIKARFTYKKYFGTRLVAFFFFYIIILWILSFVSYNNPTEVFLTGRKFCYISLSYFIWLSIYSSVKREHYIQFLNLFFIITPISAILYILNSSGIIDIFNPNLIYSEIKYKGVELIRDFRTIPIWLVPTTVMSYQFIITKTYPIKKILVYINAVILPFAVLFTYTRSLLITIIMQIIIIAFGFLTFQKKLNIFIIIRNLVSFSLILFFSIILIQKAFTIPYSYFSYRVNSAIEEGEQEKNVDVRIKYFDKALQIVEKDNNQIFGVGLNREYYKKMGAVGAWSADSTIPYFLLHTGWVGVFFMYIIMLWFCIDSFKYYIKTKDWLGLYLFASFTSTLVSSLIMGGGRLNGNVWTWMNLGLFTVLKFNLWKKKKLAVKIKNQSLSQL